MTDLRRACSTAEVGQTCVSGPREAWHTMTVPTCGQPASDEVETVRCILQRHNGDILLLQKSPDSKAASLYELPGGKIDAISARISTLREQTQSTVQEVFEETDIDLSSHPPKKTEEITYAFEHKGKLYRRRVHMFHVVLAVDDDAVVIGKTVNADGEPEDKHARFVWVSERELIELADRGRLSGNSLRFAHTLASASSS